MFIYNYFSLFFICITMHFGVKTLHLKIFKAFCLSYFLFFGCYIFGHLLFTFGLSFLPVQIIVHCIYFFTVWVFHAMELPIETTPLVLLALKPTSWATGTFNKYKNLVYVHQTCDSGALKELQIPWQRTSFGKDQFLCWCVKLWRKFKLEKRWFERVCGLWLGDFYWQLLIIFSSFKHLPVC